jgi:hypothetical protein
MEVLYLKSQGLPGEQIQRLCAISKAAYYRYLEEYRMAAPGQKHRSIRAAGSHLRLVH